MTERFDNTANQQHQLDPTWLGDFLTQAESETIEMAAEIERTVAITVAGQHGGVVHQEVASAGHYRTMGAAVALPRNGSSVASHFQNEIAADQRAVIRDATLGVLEVADRPDSLDTRWFQFPREDSRLGGVLADIYHDVLRGPDGGRPTDYTDVNHSAYILNSVRGFSYFDKQAEPIPLTESEADDLVELMPVILANDTYKMAMWHGSAYALGSSAELIEHLAITYPNKVRDIDVDASLYALLTLSVAAEVDIAAGGSLQTLQDARNRANHYEKVIDTFNRIKAHQKLIAAEPRY